MMVNKQMRLSLLVALLEVAAATATFAADA
jgi:hypothetical protein